MMFLYIIDGDLFLPVGCLYIKCCGQDKEVAGIIENVYSKFKLMLIKKDENSKNSAFFEIS